MVVNIIKDKDNQPVGWTMEGENREEINKLIHIRNLQFFGIDETSIKYNGRTGGDDKDHNPGILSWIQKRFLIREKP